MVTSDHVPLLLRCSQHGSLPPPHRLEKFWFRYPDFAQITDQIFTSPPTPFPDPLVAFNNNIQTLHGRLRSWHLSKFRNSDQYLRNCKQLISFFDTLEERRPLTPLELFIRITVRERAYELSTNDELRWHQRARCRWLAAGDRNTGYFHALASSKRSRKAITSVQIHGEDATNLADIISAFTSHYSSLMGSKQPVQPIDVSSLYQHQLDLSHLEAPFTSLEAQTAVTQLASNRASGPDGFPNKFIKQHWNTLQPHIMPILHQFSSQQLDLTPN